MVRVVFIILFTIFLFSLAGNHDSHPAANRQDITTEISCSQPAIITEGQRIIHSFDFFSVSDHPHFQLFQPAFRSLAEAISEHHMLTGRQRARLEIMFLINKVLIRHFHSFDTGDLPGLS
jgi:hypothetical protein